MTTKTIVSLMLASMLSLAGSVALASPAKSPSASGVANDGLIHVATCNDGKEYWNATGEHRGACGGHKGVAKWADGSPVKARKASSYR